MKLYLRFVLQLPQCTKFHPRIGHEGPSLAVLPFGKKPYSQCTGDSGWAPGPVWSVAVNLVPTRFNPQTLQSVARHYTYVDPGNKTLEIILHTVHISTSDTQETLHTSDTHEILCTSDTQEILCTPDTQDCAHQVHKKLRTFHTRKTAVFLVYLMCAVFII